MLLPDHLAALTTLVGDRLEETSGPLSPRAAAVVLTLASRGALEISALAKIVDVAQPTATRLVDGLEKQGLVERAPKIGRLVSVELTPTGRDQALTIREARRTETENMCAGLTVEQRALFAWLIERFLFANTESRRGARVTCRYCDHGICQGEACPVNRKATEVETQREAGTDRREEPHATHP